MNSSFDSSKLCLHGMIHTLTYKGIAVFFLYHLDPAAGLRLNRIRLPLEKGLGSGKCETLSNSRDQGHSYEENPVLTTSSTNQDSSI